MIKLSRTSCFTAGILLIAFVWFAERMRFVAGSSKVSGKFVFYIEEVVDNEKIYFPIIEYEHKSKYTQKDTVYEFRAKENTMYEKGEEVPVLLRDGDPEWPMLYTVGGFWLPPLAYYILPLMLWSAFCFSYIGKKEKVLIGFRPFFIRREKK
jgi:hypothetical protein